MGYIQLFIYYIFLFLNINWHNCHIFWSIKQGIGTMATQKVGFCSSISPRSQALDGHIGWRNDDLERSLGRASRETVGFDGVCGWGRNTTQLCEDYFLNHEIRIPIKQPGFKGNLNLNYCVCLVGDFFADCTMGSIAIFHHRVAEYFWLFFPSHF